MKRMLEHLVNKTFKEDMELLLGNQSEIAVNSINFSTNKKTYVIDVTAKVSNLTDSIEVFPDGLNYLVEQGWQFIHHDNKPIIISSLNN